MGIAAEDAIAKMEVLLIFGNQPVPHLIGGCHHPVGTVLGIEIAQIVKHFVFQRGHGVEIDGLAINDVAGHTLRGVELIDIVGIEEVGHGVESGHLLQALKDIGHIGSGLGQGVEHAVAIDLVGLHKLVATEGGARQQFVLAVEHDDGVA